MAPTDLVVVVGGDALYRACLTEIVRSLGDVSSSGGEDTSWLDAVADRRSVVVLVHDQRPRIDALECARKAAARAFHASVIAVFDPRDLSRATEIAADPTLFACLIKPVPNEVVRLTVRRGLEFSTLRALRSRATAKTDGDEIRRRVLETFV